MGAAVGTHVALATAEETTYGTPVTVNRFHEILSESLERRNHTISSNGLRAGARNLRRGSRRVLSARDGGGDLNLEVATVGMGRLFAHMLGGTSTIAQQGVTPAYLQTHQMGSLLGKSLTVQKQLRDEADAVVATLTFHGTKVLAWEFSISVDQILQLKLTLDSEDVDTATAAAAPSYPTQKVFHFMQGTLKIAGSAVANVLNAKVAGANHLKTDRYFLGSAGLKAEPTDNNFPAVSGDLAAEFLDLGLYNRFKDDSPAELILEFAGDVISGAESELCRITVPEIRLTGGTPTVGGPDVVVVDTPFEGFYNGSLAGVTVEYKSTDTAI